MELEIRNTAIPTHIVTRWQQFVDTISDLLSVPSAMINRVDPPELEVFRSSSNSDNPFPSGTRMELAGIYCAAAMKEKQKVQVVDARKDPLWADSPTAKAGIFAYIGFPIYWPGGEVFGTICAVDTQENKWGKRFEKLMNNFKDAVETHLALVLTIEQLDARNQELHNALNEVKTLQGLLPICSVCKKIRDDTGYWQQVEVYVGDHTEADFSHGYCPECYEKAMKEMDDPEMDDKD